MTWKCWTIRCHFLCKTNTRIKWTMLRSSYDRKSLTIVLSITSKNWRFSIVNRCVSFVYYIAYYPRVRLRYIYLSIYTHIHIYIYIVFRFLFPTFILLLFWFFCFYYCPRAAYTQKRFFLLPFPFFFLFFFIVLVWN